MALAFVARSGAPAMIANLERTVATGDLPLYDRQEYARALEAGSSGRS